MVAVSSVTPRSLATPAKGAMGVVGSPEYLRPRPPAAVSHRAAPRRGPRDEVELARPGQGPAHDPARGRQGGPDPRRAAPRRPPPRRCHPLDRAARCPFRGRRQLGIRFRHQHRRAPLGFAETDSLRPPRPPRSSIGSARHPGSSTTSSWAMPARSCSAPTCRPCRSRRPARRCRSGARKSRRSWGDVSAQGQAL
jgi:hypothetical protein